MTMISDKLKTGSRRRSPKKVVKARPAASGRTAGRLRAATSAGRGAVPRSPESGCADKPPARYHMTDVLGL